VKDIKISHLNLLFRQNDEITNCGSRFYQNIFRSRRCIAAGLAASTTYAVADAGSHSKICDFLRKFLLPSLRRRSPFHPEQTFDAKTGRC
jgi:hypothetical protein